MPIISVESSLRSNINSIDFDFDQLDKLFSEVDVPESAVDKLEICLRKSPPPNAPFLYRRFWRSFLLGTYNHSPTEPKIHINIPRIKKLGREEQFTRTFLHEVGHFVDFHDKEVAEPGKLEYGILGTWLGMFIAPPAYYYSQSGEILKTCGVGAASFLASTIVAGGVIEALDKRRLSVEGKIEGEAIDFVEESFDQYPNIISVT